MSDLSLKLLGSYQASFRDKPLPEFRTKKTQALLVFLAAERAQHRRESLITLLWPGMPEQSGRSNLRQVIYYLRRSIPELGAAEGQSRGSVPLLITNRNAIQLNPAAAVDVDVYEFEAVLDRTQRHEHVELRACSECRRDLDRAVELYRGDFLADFYLDDSNEYEAWAQSKRGFYRRRVLDALAILTTMATNQGDYPQAEAYAERQLEIDNLREVATRQLMEVMALTGRREQALVLYEACRQLLIDELGMEPAARTTELYEQIMAGDLSFEAPLTHGVKGYELKEEIGEGAFGAIHLAVQPSIGRDVAVKVIRPKYADEPDFIRRFEAEAQTVARLEHPHIVPLYDYWRDPDGAYLVMRYLRGGSLLSSLESGPWEIDPALKMVEQVALALEAAHQQGVVHRDIKPANILLDETGNAYLSDFGIAKDTTAMLGLTATHAVVGTPDYVSPEQITNDPVSGRTDIYSLGLVLYETLTGEKPFPDSSIANLLHKQLHEPVPLVSASRPDVSTVVDEVIQRATAKQPADRYATALEMAAAFRSAVQGVSVDAAGPLIAPEVAELYNPYKGLRAFQEADADDFYGREGLVEQLISGIADSRFLAVVGPSGGGKSSAVKAGLIPALRKGVISSRDGVARSDKWFVAEMTPGAHPLDELELALWPIAVDPPPSLVEPMRYDTRGLSRTIRRILPDEEGAQAGHGPQLLLVIDQFEELFTLVEDEEEREFFIDSLLTAVRDPRGPLRVVVTLRADFYDRPLQMQSLAKLLKENTEIVLPMTAEELTWAVREPARRVGIRLELGLAEAIVADVSDQPGALPLLQYALTELFEKRQNRLMTSDVYQEIGGVTGALGRRAEEIFETLDAGSQAAARQIFMRLVTLGEGVEDTRRRVLRSELTALVGALREAPLPAVDAVIDEYGRARLLTFDRDPVTREPTAEVAHEALLREWGRLRGWLSESRNDVRMQRTLAQAAAEWQAAGQEPGFLLREARLDQFAGWAENSTVALTGDEQHFLAASIAAREARQAEEEARRQQELETAQKLAVTERARAEAEEQRAEEQAQAAAGLRRRALLLTGALVVAAVLAIAAIFFASQSNQNAESAAAEADQRATAQAFAEDQRGIAETEADSRATAQAQAEANEAAAIAQQATAQAEADFRATAEAVANEERVAAEELRQAALVQASIGLASQSELELSGDQQELAVPLALEAIENYPYTWQAERALGKAVFDSHLELILPHEGAVNSVKWSPDQTRIVTASSDGMARVWDAASGELLVSLDFEGDGQVYALNWSPAGDQVTTVALPQNKVYTWDTETGLLVLTLDGDQHRTGGWSPSGDRILTTSPDGTATIWDAVTGEEITTFAGHDDTVYACTVWGDCSDGILAWSPAGDRVVTVDEAGEIFIWDSFTGEELLHLSGHEDFVNMATWSPDGQWIASASDDRTGRIWDANTGEQVAIYEAADASRCCLGAVWSPDSDRVVLHTNASNSIIIIDAATGEELLVFDEHEAGVWAAIWSDDGNRILSNSRDGTARIWDSWTGEEEKVFRAHSEDAYSAAWSPSEEHVVTGGADGIAKVWSVAGPMDDFGRPAGGARHDWSPANDLIALSNPTEEIHQVQIIDANTGEIRLTIPAHNRAEERDIQRVAFSPSGDDLLSSSTNGITRIWKVADGSLLTEVANEAGFYWAEWSPEGTKFATGASDIGVVQIWDAQTGEVLVAFDEHVGTVRGLAWSPDGKRMASTGGGGKLLIWDTATGEVALDLFSDGLNLQVGQPAWSADGSRIAAARADGSISIWDSTTGDLLQSITGLDGLHRWLYWFPSGDRLLSNSQNVLKVWEVGSGSEVLSINSGDNTTLSSDGRRVIIGQWPFGPMKVIRIWQSLDELVALAKECCLVRELTPDERVQFGLSESRPSSGG